MSFAIQNLEGQLLGFLLMTNQGPYGECIFRLSPKKSNIFENENLDALQELQTIGKLRFIISKDVIHIRHPKISEPIIIENNLLTVQEQAYQLVELNEG